MKVNRIKDLTDEPEQNLSVVQVTIEEGRETCTVVSDEQIVLHLLKMSFNTEFLLRFILELMSLYKSVNLNSDPHRLVVIHD